MENIKIFEKHFRNGMVNKDFNTFIQTHPTLLKCIINAMDEVNKTNCIEFAIWLRENDTQENAEIFANFYDEDMFDYWVKNVK